MTMNDGKILEVCGWR